MKVKKLILVLIVALLVSCDGGSATSYSKSKYYQVSAGRQINIKGEYLIINNGVINKYGQARQKEDGSVFFIYVEHSYVKVVDGALYTSETWGEQYGEGGNIVKQDDPLDKNEANFKYAGLINNGFFRSDRFYQPNGADMQFESLYVTHEHAKKANMEIVYDFF